MFYMCCVKRDVITLSVSVLCEKSLALSRSEIWDLEAISERVAK